MGEIMPIYGDVYLSLVGFQDTTDDTCGGTHGAVEHVYELGTLSHLLCLAVPHLQPEREVIFRKLGY